MGGWGVIAADDGRAPRPAGPVRPDAPADSAASVGLLIAFYCGLTGFACVWFFRRDLLGSVRALLLNGILPGLGGLALLAAFVLSIISYWPAASSCSGFDSVGGIFLIGAGSLPAGVFLMVAARRWLPAFFAGGTLPPLANICYAPAPAASGSPETAGPGPGAPAAAAPAPPVAPVPAVALEAVCGVGIPLALGDPAITAEGAIHEVLAALEQLVGLG